MADAYPARERLWSVVLVDDSDDLRMLARLLLERTNRFDVIGEAANGKDAVDLVSTLHPDIVLLDLQMPLMDGFEALPLIKEAVRDDSLVVIWSALVKESESKLAQTLMDSGAGAVLPKGELEELPAQLWTLVTA